MNQLNKMWIAASVAVSQSHTEQGQLKSGLRSLQLTRRRFSSGGGDTSGVRSVAGASAVGSSVVGLVENCEEKLRQADESLQKVMYLNCWGQG